MGPLIYDHPRGKGPRALSDNSSRRDAALKNLDKELKSRSRREKMRPLGVTLATLVVLVGLVGGIWYAATRGGDDETCLLYTSPSPRDRTRSRMPSSA